MGFFHKTLKDALIQAELGELDKVRDVIEEHRRRFKIDENFSSGMEVETLQFIIEDWNKLLGDKFEWQALDKKATIKRLKDLEQRVVTFKRIIKRILEEEDVILE